jgi:ADP-ribose pyrophosphatase YjhB (NUDIX family)
MNRLYPERPFVGIGGVVFRGEEVLLVKRAQAPRRGEWSIPGGVQLLGETVYEALRREVQEETGLHVEVVDVVAIVDAIFRDEDGRVKYHYTLIDLLAEWQSGEARAGDDVSDCAWVALARVGDYGLWEETLRVIRLAAEKRKR